MAGWKKFAEKLGRAYKAMSYYLFKRSSIVVFGASIVILADLVVQFGETVQVQCTGEKEGTGWSGGSGIRWWY